jgi:hypothetical protein
MKTIKLLKCMQVIYFDGGTYKVVTGHLFAESNGAPNWSGPMRVLGKNSSLNAFCVFECLDAFLKGHGTSECVKNSEIVNGKQLPTDSLTLVEVGTNQYVVVNGTYDVNRLRNGESMYRTFTVADEYIGLTAHRADEVTVQWVHRVISAWKLKSAEKSIGDKPQNEVPLQKGRSGNGPRDRDLLR